MAETPDLGPADRAALVQRLVEGTFTAFPAAMDWPLVAAAAVQPGSDELVPITTNVMRIGREPVHAEELLLEEVGDRTDFEIVVTMEPCGPGDRTTSDEIPCSSRIVEFARTRRIGLVIVGMFRNGRGLRQLTKAGIDVLLLLGPGHQELITKRNIREVVEGVNREAQAHHRKTREAVGSVRFREPVELDQLNRESYLRLRRAEEERAAQVREIVSWLERHARLSAEEIFNKLLVEHGTYFTEEDRAEYLIALAGEWRRPDGSIDPDRCAGQVALRVNYTLRQSRKHRVEAEIRRRSAQ